MIARQLNVLGQMRLDAPHVRAMESSVTNDFDVLAGTIIAGQRPLVVSGFSFAIAGISRAETLPLLVAGSSIIHFNASESGSIFQVPADRAIEILSSTNTRIVGSWTPNQVNYVGLDLIRSADDSTSDLVQFIDTTTTLETGRVVPLGRTLDYRIVISTSDFSAQPSVCPLAKVTLDASNGITSFVDARNILGSLAVGGSLPDTNHAYSWPGNRTTVGDKAIGSVKEWMDAVMTRIWELGGGEHWFSSTADRNAKLARTGSPFVSNGENFEWTGSFLHWQGLVVVFSNSTGAYNVIQDKTGNTAGVNDLADGECLYVDLDPSTTRTGGTSLVPAKTTLTTLGNPTIPGTRWVLAWRYGSSIYTRDQVWAVGSAFKIATTSALGMVRLSSSDYGTGGSSAPRVVTCDSTAGLAVAAGLTRGDVGLNVGIDFFLGAGPIYIGGDSNDQQVAIGTTRSQDSVYLYGNNNTLADNSAPLVVYNAHDFSGSLADAVAIFSARNTNGNNTEWNNSIDANGAVGFRKAYGEVSFANSSTTNLIDQKIFFKTIDAAVQPSVKYRSDTNGIDHPICMGGGNYENRWTGNALILDNTLVGSYYNDFTGQAPTGKINSTGAGGTNAYSTTLRGGVYVLTTSGSTGSLQWNPSPDETTIPFFLANPATENWDFSFRIKLGQALTADTLLRFGWGTGDCLNFSSTGLAFRNNAGTLYVVPWSTDTNWHVFRCAKSTAGITVWIDGTQAYQSSSPVAGLGTAPCSLLALVSNLGSTSQTVSIDKAFAAFRLP